MTSSLDDATPRTRAALTRTKQQVARYGQQQASRSINRQSILTEDEYTEGLERIIARDFFPLVSKRFKQQEQEQEILLGFQSDDPDIIERSVRRVQDWIGVRNDWSLRSSSRKERTQHTPRGPSTVGDTPRHNFGETPVTRPGQDAATSRLRYNPDLTLDEFQSKYTSEDNASFAQIIDDENVARRGKYAWAYKAENAANDRTRRAIEARTKLVDLARRLTEGDMEIRLIEHAESGRPGARMLIEGRQSLPGDSASMQYAQRRLLASGPSQDRLMIEAGRDSDEAKAALMKREQALQKAIDDGHADAAKQIEEASSASVVHNWRFTARNNFYFAPDANVPVQDTNRRTGDGATGSAHKATVEAVDELGITEPKGIRHAGTRIFTQEGYEDAARQAGIPSSPSHSNIAAAISGTPYPGRSSASMTPRVNGYSFVDAMPSPTVSQLGQDGLKALMTFGTLTATPIALRGDDDDDRPAKPKQELVEGPFKIPAAPRRDVLAHKMASKATKSLLQRNGFKGSSSGLALGTPTASPGGRTPVKDSGNATPGRDAYLSSAAKNLLGRTVTFKRAHPSDSPVISTTRVDDRAQGMQRYKRAKWD